MTHRSPIRTTPQGRNHDGSYTRGEQMKPWPDWALWAMFVLCLVASICIALI